jgi:Peptidase propeptide and YPEB domain
VLVVAGVLVLAFFVARGCQQAQVRITKEQAITTAEREVRFEPTNTNVRLLRQGLGAKPYWFVNLSDREGAIVRRLTVVQVDANNGKVVDVDRQR